ncbi:unnamed protein product [Cuscuta epithymum]|uniref:Uncharacterized protein n=1 Tax=Cuscuta epithymum TaxID=186058 RepID=A0AAV0DNJ2_9ASTE|nr:unnamed protein product [Cuscuta epithymum]
MPFQKDIDGTTWNYTQSNQQKIFKPEVQRNKPDLPAQKNLLTKYFCIASIEAKQEFRAPWVVPIHPNPEDGSPSALLDSFTEDDSCELGSSSVSPPVREDENNVDDIASATGDCHLESTSNGIREELVSDDQGMHNQTPFRHSICKPCVLLHKDRASSRSKSKTIITENGKVVVRSSYFLPKKTEKENISDESANDICKSTISAEECPSASVAIDAKTKTVNPITTLKSFEFQCDSTEEKYNSKMKSEKKKIVRSRNSLEDAIAAEVDETVKPESSLRYNEGTLTKQKDTEKELKASCNTFGDSSPKDHCKPNFAEECPSASVAIEGKMKTVDPITTLRSFEFQHTSAEEKNNSKMKSEKRKVVRSSYFQQQVSSNGNSIEDAIAAEVDETSENCLHHSEGNLRKRKVAFNNANENDTVKGLKASRNTFGDSSSNNKFDPAFDNYDSTGEVKADNMKFGSDVSHLGKYGEISEKSVEKFVSVISSFKFTSNGSRASGLRAPLKDIRNVSKSSSPREMDLDRFVYLPTKQKPYSARRKT